MAPVCRDWPRARPLRKATGFVTERPPLRELVAGTHQEKDAAKQTSIIPVGAFLANDFLSLSRECGAFL